MGGVRCSVWHTLGSSCGRDRVSAPRVDRGDRGRLQSLRCGCAQRVIVFLLGDWPRRSLSSSVAARSTGDMPVETIRTATPSWCATITPPTDLRRRRRTHHSPSITATSATRCGCSTRHSSPAARALFPQSTPPCSAKSTASPRAAHSASHAPAALRQPLPCSPRP